MTALWPTAAAIPASAAPALPVEAVTVTSAPISSARATTTDDARSLYEAVGLRPSSLIHKFRRPSCLASRSVLYVGVQPALRSGVPSKPGSLTGRSGK